MKYRHSAIQPSPVIAPRFRLDLAPRKFADPHPGKPQFGHPPRIVIPLVFRPMFRIVANAKTHGRFHRRHSSFKSPVVPTSGTTKRNNNMNMIYWLYAGNRIGLGHGLSDAKRLPDAGWCPSAAI